MLQSGQLLDGRYQIQDKLGEGAFGETYKASDQRRPSKPICVVKWLKAQHTSPIVQSLFEKEAAVLEKLGEHPQIPRLLAHFMSEHGLFIVQEFVEGHSLDQEIQPGKLLSESYVTQLLQNILEILAFVHENGVIHRDIKPANVMRRRDGKLVLIDFGVVKELGSIAVLPGGVVKTSLIAGTPGYIPFEQNRGKPGLYSDIYAVGMMAIEALTGIAPYHLPEDPETGETLWRDRVQISDRLATFLEKMVCDRYTQRYQSAIEALQALQQIVIALPPDTRATATGRNHLQALQTVIAPALPTFTFEVITVKQGKEISRRPERAEYFVENLRNGITLEMVKVRGSSFSMGSPENEPGRDNDEGLQHQVTVSTFFMGKFAVTQAQYFAVVGYNPSGFRGGKRPVEMVSWNDTVVFCSRLSRKTGRTYRLPSEAEWEYACRAGTTAPFHFGATITPEFVNCGRDWILSTSKREEIPQEQTTPVGTYLPNAFGLYDMHGNVKEWCQDHWHDNYDGAPIDGSAWAADGTENLRLLRGGSWRSAPDNCRSANRDRDDPGFRDDYIGFRVACSLAQTP